jgi:hypothetical protein
MSEKYNVLWIDDQHEKMKAVHKTATDFNIKLWPYKSMNGGCKELKANISKYDAVLLDAKFFENESDMPGTEDTRWVHKTKDFIRDLDKTLAYFVWTGQAKTFASPEFNNAFPHVFDKGLDKDEDALFKKLVEVCENRTETKLKHKYPNSIAVCDDNYIGKKEFSRVLQIIKDIEHPENIINQQDALSPIRKILEAIFKKLNNIGLIPDEIQNGQGAINGASIFLAGINNEYIYEEELIHPVISESIRHLIGLTQDASHNEGNKLGAYTYLSNTSNTFLYQSLCYSMIEVLEYLKPFIDNNGDVDKNKSKWEAIANKAYNSNDWILGKVIRITDGWGTFKSELGLITSIIPKMVEKHRLQEGDKISVVTKPSGEKTHIIEIKKN